ncbi:23S rRNA (uracil(1939)-C(5))-methyltransferase RlmD [Candidatus Peregrinibacteria bacterium]|jgi:23S rRNA (uracil1939-C5)-methyltransferase|nr:23S rRNA (uracil(1939)-C(5))-methyltransferase RlmD [Candidatus Peregrinibacteria bacterium]MBT4631450.1 23S rRNA (uracil(1939)-C(5))-methyltransferase RlmD [Candidatus Peregrinibacteria bacterium]MBT5516901.1 23S rRNA (uracil(1939)-C(5))-methyltransferase RlmD [Candidatus Peregrinibacteria bacterium]MBT5823839.1 23S rRNA (uracil(1939)-C(5))-methyltransferase RlmD [Candidatus Peregrinibacteria bacterium]
MKPKKNTEVELRIDRLVYGGKGIGQVDGFKIFVAGVAPGDLVKVRIFKVKSKYAEGLLLEVLEPSEGRVQPKCAHFDTCGGCKWQFLPYEKQLEVKEQQVRDSIERLADMPGELVQPIIGCSEPWYYRNKMELSFGPGPREDAERVMIGFYPPGFHYEVFDLKECHLENEWMADLVGAVRDFANKLGLKVYHSASHEGLLRNLIIREGKNTGEVMVILVTSTETFDHLEEFKALFEAFPQVSSLYWSTVYQVKGQPTYREDKLLSGKETLTEELKCGEQVLSFDILPQAFFQTNTAQAEVLYSKVLELADLTGEETVMDLYCGTGTIGLFCAHKAGKVIGIEVNEAAVDSARQNAIKNGIKNAVFYLGAVDKRLSTMEESPDVLIVDPPRAGLGEKVVEQCAAFEPNRIVYVSCNPTSMARDLTYFKNLGYKTAHVTPVDMFPQTHHIESICLLER